MEVLGSSQWIRPSPTTFTRFRCGSRLRQIRSRSRKRTRRAKTRSEEWSILRLPEQLAQRAPSRNATKELESSTMKKLLLLSTLCRGLALALGLSLLPTVAMAQNPKPVVGNWEGTLDPGAQAKKRIVVHISAAQDGSLSGTIDFPDQYTSGIQITAITYKEPALHCESTPSLIVYDGTMGADKSSIVGTLKQAAQSLDLVLKRTP